MAKDDVPEHVQQLVEALGGKVVDAVRLPDGSGFATASMPLPADHWLLAVHRNVPPMPLRMGVHDVRHPAWVERIRAAARYAIRAATMNGKEMDFDPDALIQNLVVGFLGYWTPDGLSTDVWANPSPVPLFWLGDRVPVDREGDR